MAGFNMKMLPVLTLCISAMLSQPVVSCDHLIENLRASSRDEKPVLIYVIVALCDNENQGIIKVSKKLGDGENPQHNLYWGASYGVKTFFKKSMNWQLLSTVDKPDSNVLERCVFKRTSKHVYLIADAYRGCKIKYAIDRFLNIAAGNCSELICLDDSLESKLNIGDAQLIAYVGHNGLMDFDLYSIPQSDSTAISKDLIILACDSRQYFAEIIKKYEIYPLLWTCNLLAPEAYVLEAAIEGWLNLENAEQILDRAISVYSKYQKCKKSAAGQIFQTGW